MKRIPGARRRLAGILAAGLAVTGAAALPAYAAAPVNDSILRPVQVSIIPATYTLDTSEATATAADGKCVRGASVWYRYRPAFTANGRVSTIGSDYDTYLAVFRGTRANRTLIACNDDRVDLAAAAGVRFVTGYTYWIAVSACCSRAATGGHAEIRFTRPRAAAVTTTIDAVDTGTASGRLYVSGTTSCATPSQASVWFVASQRVGTNVARGEAGTTFWCLPDPTSWRLPVDSATTWAFQTGSATIDADSSAWDGFTGATSEVLTTTTVGSDPNIAGPGQHPDR